MWRGPVVAAARVKGDDETEHESEATFYTLMKVYSPGPAWISYSPLAHISFME